MGIALLLIITGLYGIYYFSLSKAPQATPLKQPAFTQSSVLPTQPTDQQRQAYQVPPDQPRQLIIDTLHINANILPMHTLKSGELETPKTAWEVGWYAQSALPGSTKGALLIDGHVNDALNQPGVFFHLGQLQPNDTLQIQRGDSQMFTYQVKKVEQVPTAQVDMSKLLVSHGDKEGLNLITCGGTYDKARQTYSDRVIVYAARL